MNKQIQLKPSFKQIADERMQEVRILMEMAKDELKELTEKTHLKLIKG